MNTCLVIIESVIFLILSGVHWNWAFGGLWGLEKALPTNEKGERVLNPKRIESGIAGIGLLLFATYYLFKGNLIPVDLPNWILNYIGWVISGIFIIRAIGDFRYVGFFKKLKETDFGKLDTKFYSPLCLGTGMIAIIIEMIN